MHHPDFPAVERVLEDKRRTYPALKGKPTFAELRAICDKEGVTIVQDGRLPMAGAMVMFDGEWTLFLSTRLAWSLCPPTMLHELAHLWCHHDPYAERSERLFTVLLDESHDPREAEADHMVSLVYGHDYAVGRLTPDDFGRERVG